ncbi:MAG TPA: Gfo/Idh/MocA family oxidoreductase [Kofleriaceae bacterium]|nr:Gfo/Idh/MocA family oxidoreductase [Kofleriaceae bacterium]
MTRGEKLRMAVIGQGYFAQAAILPAIEQLPDVELTALISGSRHKLDELGERYNVRTLCDYDQLDGLLASGRIDAVYIAVPNDLHARLAVLAAKRKIHVLCEKPMAPTDAECFEMIRACEQSNVKLMIAYRLHFESANLVAVELARSGDIGEPRIFSSTFTQQVREDNVRTQPRRGSGPVYDVGVYCINAARYIFRAEPVEVSAMRFASRDPRFRAIDEAISVTMRFPNERVAQFTCSFGAHARAHYEVIGTDGFLELDHAYEYGSSIQMHVEGVHGPRLRTFEQRDQIAGEVEYFARCIREDKAPEPGGYEGLADVRIIQAIMSSARFGRAVPIEPLERRSRPDLGQAENIQPHGRATLVDVVATTR